MDKNKTETAQVQWFAYRGGLILAGVICLLDLICQGFRGCLINEDGILQYKHIIVTIISYSSPTAFTAYIIAFLQHYIYRSDAGFVEQEGKQIGLFFVSITYLGIYIILFCAFPGGIHRYLILLIITAIYIFLLRSGLKLEPPRNVKKMEGRSPSNTEPGV